MNPRVTVTIAVLLGVLGVLKGRQSGFFTRLGGAISGDYRVNGSA